MDLLWWRNLVPVPSGVALMGVTPASFFPVSSEVHCAHLTQVTQL